MATMTIQFDPVAMREATTQALMGIMTPEMKHEAIRSAITALLTPSTNSWDKGKSPIERHFEEAVSNVARDVVKEAVATDPEIVAKINRLTMEAIAKMLNADPGKLAERMADAFVSSIRKDY